MRFRALAFVGEKGESSGYRGQSTESLAISNYLSLSSRQRNRHSCAAFVLAWKPCVLHRMRAPLQRLAGSVHTEGERDLLPSRPNKMSVSKKCPRNRSVISFRPFSKPFPFSSSSLSPVFIPRETPKFSSFFGPGAARRATSGPLSIAFSKSCLFSLLSLSLPQEKHRSTALNLIPEPAESPRERQQKSLPRFFSGMREKRELLMGTRDVPFRREGKCTTHGGTQERRRWAQSRKI